MALPLSSLGATDDGRHQDINAPTHKRLEQFHPLERYLIVQRIGRAGQLALNAPDVWRACHNVLSTVRGPTGWELRAGPTEALWFIRTPAGFEELRWHLEFQLPDDVEWALFRRRDSRAHRSGWNNDADWQWVYSQLDQWADDPTSDD